MEETSDNKKADEGGTPFQPVSDSSIKPTSNLSSDDELKKEISKELESSKNSFRRPTSISDILEKELSGISSDLSSSEANAQKSVPVSPSQQKSPVSSVAEQTTQKVVQGKDNLSQSKVSEPPPIKKVDEKTEIKPIVEETKKEEAKPQSNLAKPQVPDLSSVAVPMDGEKPKTGAAKLDDERGAFTPPPTPRVSSTVLESEFKNRQALQNQKDKSFIKETQFSREREIIPEKKEKEFVSREPETSKEIIRTFQKDLLRRQNEVRREDNIPEEKEVMGFTPPTAPEAAKSAPKFSVPKIPLPKISLKFALIIVGLVVFLSGFYIIFQLKPCIPPFCKKEVPTIAACDKDQLRNICVDDNASFPDCDTTGLCNEIGVTICSKENICQALGGPISSCEPVELVSPASILSYLSEEKIVISEKTKDAILNGLSNVEQNITQRPYLVNVLIEYDEDECNKSWLSAADFFSLFGITTPSGFFENVKEDNYNLLLYLPDAEERNTCIAQNISDSSCYGPRLAMAFLTVNFENTKAMMGNWEQTFFTDLSPLILGSPVDSADDFGGSLYKDKIEFRYKNFPTSTTALNYGVYKNILIIGTSKNSLYKTADFILRKDEQAAADEQAIQ